MDRIKFKVGDIVIVNIEYRGGFQYAAKDFPEKVQCEITKISSHEPKFEVRTLTWKTDKFDPIAWAHTHEISLSSNRWTA